MHPADIGNLEDFVTWVLLSKIKRNIIEYSDKVITQFLFARLLITSLTSLIYLNPWWSVDQMGWVC
jgi:hypothetical protein